MIGTGSLIYMSRGGGIRTPGPREGSPVFKTGAINRSTTPLFYPPGLFAKAGDAFIRFGIAKIVVWAELQNRKNQRLTFHCLPHFLCDPRSINLNGLHQHFMRRASYIHVG